MLITRFCFFFPDAFFPFSIFITVQVNLGIVKSEMKVCYFGQPSQLPPNSTDLDQWMKLVIEDIRKRCPGNQDTGENLISDFKRKRALKCGKGRG